MRVLLWELSDLSEFRPITIAMESIEGSDGEWPGKSFAISGVDSGHLSMDSWNR